MVELTYLASGFVMGVLLVAISVAVMTARNWEHYSPPGDGDAVSVFVRVARSPALWMVGFLGVAAVMLAGTVMFVGGLSVPTELQQNAGVAIAGLFLALLVGFLFVGTYQGARYRGFASAQATMIGTWAVGLAFIGAVVVALVTGA